MRMPGSMNIAFGKCNDTDPSMEQRLDNTLDVAFWIDVLGLRKIEVWCCLLICQHKKRPVFRARKGFEAEYS